MTFRSCTLTVHHSLLEISEWIYEGIEIQYVDILFEVHFLKIKY